jgi:hypothetical protein
VFIADIRKAERLLGWRPQVGVSKGIDSLMGWVRSTFRHELVNAEVVSQPATRDRQ